MKNQTAAAVKENEQQNHTRQPSDEELLARIGRAMEEVRRRGLDKLFAPMMPVAATLEEDLRQVAESFPPEGPAWEPTCLRCGASMGYTTKRHSYVIGRTECNDCRKGSLADRLTASGVSFREINQELSALKNHDPDGKPYGTEYDRWLLFLARFASLTPGKRLDPPFAFACGSNGIGKSAGAERALRDAIRNGCTGRVVTFRELVRKIVSTYGRDAKDVDERADDIVRLYAGIHLLVIQEVGMEDPTEHNYGLFFDFVDERWRACLPTIFTSNYSPEEDSLGTVMTQRMIDETKMRAILDRIRGGVRENLFVLRGKSWRGREAM